MKSNPTHIVDDVLETVVTDEDVRRAYSEDVVDENTGDLVYSKSIMAMYRKIKRGSGKENDERSRRIVEELRAKRDAMACDMLGTPMGVGQSTLFDFGE